MSITVYARKTIAPNWEKTSLDNFRL